MITQFDRPEDLLGVIFVLIAVILFLLLGINLLLSYRRNRRSSTLYMSLILLFGAGALISLVIEQMLLIASGMTGADAPPLKAFWQYSFDEIDVFWVAYVFAILAWITSASAVLSGTFFTQSFFPEDSFFGNRKLLFIPAIMLILFVSVLVYTEFQWIEVAGDWQPTRDITFVIISYILLFPNLWMIVLLFLYLVISLYRRGLPRWRQTLLLALGQFFLSVGYTVEIVNIPEPTLSMLSRLAIALYPIVMWLGFTPPKWFKRIIGVTS